MAKQNPNPPAATASGLAATPASGGASTSDRIRQAVEARVRQSHAGDVNYFELLSQLSDPAISVEMVTGALRRLAEEGLLVEHRREKVGRAEAKDRKVIQYRATPKFVAALTGGAAAPAPSETPEMTLRRLHEYAESAGFITTTEAVTNFFLCLQAKPFVIISGISGTGKTHLPRLVAEAIRAKHDLIPVKPNWSDNSDLMGYYSVTLNDFVPGKMLEVVRAAEQDATRAHFVVLDEMNLAHVEHYLSDLLSVAETRRRTASGEVVTDPLPLDLPLPADTTTADRWASLRGAGLPWNLFVVGTVNVDETTHPFSRKVLDRAYAIDFSEVDLARYGGSGSQIPQMPATASALFLDRPLSVREVYSIDPGFFDQIARELTQVNAVLQAADLQFAYRVRDEIALYMWAWHRHKLDSLLTRDDAFDYCLLQKILPRCQGSSETARRALEGIFRFAATIVPADPAAEAAGSASTTPAGIPAVETAEGTAIDPHRVTEPTDRTKWRHPRTARKALRMLRRYADTGYFAFWT